MFDDKKCGKKKLFKNFFKWYGIVLFVVAFIFLLALQVRTMTINRLAQTYNAGYTKAINDIGQMVKQNIEARGEMKFYFGNGEVMTLVEGENSI